MCIIRVGTQKTCRATFCGRHLNPSYYSLQPFYIVKWNEMKPFYSHLSWRRAWDPSHSILQLAIQPGCQDYLRLYTISDPTSHTSPFTQWVSSSFFRSSLNAKCFSESNPSLCEWQFYTFLAVCYGSLEMDAFFTSYSVKMWPEPKGCLKGMLPSCYPFIVQQRPCQMQNETVSALFCSIRELFHTQLCSRLDSPIVPAQMRRVRCIHLP